MEANQCVCRGCWQGRGQHKELVTSHNFSLSFFSIALVFSDSFILGASGQYTIERNTLKPLWVCTFEDKTFFLIIKYLWSQVNVINNIVRQSSSTVQMLEALPSPQTKLGKFLLILSKILLISFTKFFATFNYKHTLILCWKFCEIK